MNTKVIKLFACVIGSLFLISATGKAQQSRTSTNTAIIQAPVIPVDGVYGYTLFIAPNKVYGYNIFKNGRLIFRQAASAEAGSNQQSSIITKTQADKAAVIAIQKIKKGMPGELSGEELKQVIAQ